MNYIITWSDGNYINLFKDFVVSLFTLGKFKGKAIYFYYYENDKEENADILKRISSTFNVTIIRQKKFCHMNQTIYITLKDLLFADFFNKEDKIALFDVDFWFQDDMNELFNLKPKRFLFAQEINPPKHYSSTMSGYIEKPHVVGFFNDFPKEEKEYILKKFDDMAKSINMINSGFMYGSYLHMKVFIEWINIYYQKYSELMNKFSADQFLVNYSLSTELDDFTGYKYNYCIFYNKDRWKINEKNQLIIKHKNEIIKGVHLQAFKHKHNSDDHSFLKYQPEYKEIYSEIFKEE